MLRHTLMRCRYADDYAAVISPLRFTLSPRYLADAAAAARCSCHMRCRRQALMPLPLRLFSMLSPLLRALIRR